MATIRLLVSMAATLSGLCALPAATAEVAIIGLTAEQETNVRALTPLASADCSSAPWRVRRLFRDADQHIAQALEALGHYHHEISKSLEWRDLCWHAEFQVDPGPPVRLREVDIRLEGAAKADLQFLSGVRAERPARGDVLHHGRYEKYKNGLMSAALARGYFDASFRVSEVRVDRAAGAADLVLHLHSGPRYRIGEISFTEGIIRKDILLGYGDIRSGDAYLEEPVNSMLEALRTSGYFESVYVSTEPLDTDGKTVPVRVTLEPATRRVYTAGIGFASDVGPMGRLGYVNRRRNDRGHLAEGRLIGSEVRSELTAAYRWPRGDPRREWYSVVAGAQHSDTDTSESDSYKLGVRRISTRSGSWLEARYLNYALEDFVISDQDDRSELIIFGINWESVQGRELIRASRGRRLNLDLRGASDALGSDTSFLQLRATARWVISLNDRTRILSRAQIGYTMHDKLQELPPSVRFFSGGDRSVRGYDFEALGPPDASGAVLGGTRLVEASLEAERMVREQWAIAAFVDTGSAFNGSDPDFSTGIGLGVRWYSPIGPLRLDIAHPLDDRERNIRIHLVFGPDL